ncbi:MAG: hypothetical protein ACREHG_10270 [Candidatus Saccharimonadales bacterium]
MTNEDMIEQQITGELMSKLNSQTSTVREKINYAFAWDADNYYGHWLSDIELSKRMARRGWTWKKIETLWDNMHKE